MAWWDDLWNGVVEGFDWTTNAIDKAFDWTTKSVEKAIGWTDKETKAVGSDVENFVVKGITETLKIATKMVEALEASLKTVETDLTQVTSDTASALKWIGQSSSWLAHNIGGALKGVESTITNTVESVVAATIRDVENWTKDLVGGVESSLQDLERDVVDPVVKWVEGAESWFATEFSKAEQLVERDVIDPISQSVGSLVHDVSSVSNWIENDAMAAIKLITEAGDWLIWFAEHSITDIESFIEGANAANRPSEIYDEAKSSEGFALSLEQTIEQWFSE